MFGQRCNFKLPEALLVTLLGTLAVKGNEVPKAKLQLCKTQNNILRTCVEWNLEKIVR